MALEDYAVVVGIQHYPAITPGLQGPELDALAFSKWLIGDAKVPEKNVRLVVSSKYKEYNVDGVPTALTQPALDAVNAQFSDLVRLARDNFSRLPRVGRRLYIYLAGHGISPRAANQVNSAALLMANAEQYSLVHVSGRAYAEWFRQAHAFSEIVLLMDCCRNETEEIDEASVPFPPLKGGQPDQVRTLYALATQWDAVSFEQPVGEPPQTRGVFTFALLQALTKGARDSAGRLTARGLSGNVRLAVEALRNGDVPQFPKFQLGDDQDFVLIEGSTVELPTVTVSWKDTFRGQSLQLQDATYQALSPPVAVTVGPAASQLRLKAGLYNVLAAPGQYAVLKVRAGLTNDMQEVGSVTVQ
jgi:hypothetical protein